MILGEKLLLMIKFVAFFYCYKCLYPIIHTKLLKMNLSCICHGKCVIPTKRTRFAFVRYWVQHDQYCVSGAYIHKMSWILQLFTTLPQKLS
jgi:hypothetical protein